MVTAAGNSSARNLRLPVRLRMKPCKHGYSTFARFRRFDCLAWGQNLVLCLDYQTSLLCMYFSACMLIKGLIVHSQESLFFKLMLNLRGSVKRTGPVTGPVTGVPGVLLLKLLRVPCHAMPCPLCCQECGSTKVLPRPCPGACEALPPVYLGTLEQLASLRRLGNLWD